jgi:hypothetical protein
VQISFGARLLWKKIEEFQKLLEFFFLFKVRYFTFLVSCLNYKKEEQGEQEGNRRVVFSLRKLGEQAGDEIA